MALASFNEKSKWVDGNGLLSGYAVNWMRDLLSLINGLAGSAVIALAYSATPAFNGALNASARTFELTVAGDVTAPTKSNLVNGATYLFVLLVNSTGGYNVVWPSGFVNFPDLSITNYPSGLAANAVVRAEGYVRTVAGVTSVYCISSMGDQ